MFRLDSPSLKRHAGDSPPCFDHRGKRQKPNLTHGLSGLSLSGAQNRSISTEDLSDTASEASANHDVEVEGFDSPSSNSSTGSADSEVTFKHTRVRHKHRRPVIHADSVEIPPDITVDILASVPNRKRKLEDEESETKRRRRTGDMDINMDVADGLPRRSKQRTQWHEPEKDRIVITSLGSPSSSRTSSRSTSPVPSNHLSQPGTNGFTFNPSLLTHLLNSQRNEMHSVPLGQRREHGMVLYKPVHFPIVREWAATEDSSRFEELEDEDENAASPSEFAEPMDVET